MASLVSLVLYQSTEAEILDMKGSSATQKGRERNTRKEGMCSGLRDSHMLHPPLGYVRTAGPGLAGGCDIQRLRQCGCGEVQERQTDEWGASSAGLGVPLESVTYAHM